MSREIEFRGKRVDNNEFIFGSLIVDKISDKYYISISVEESENVGEEGCLRVVSCEVDKDTVGQYTGLRDKNKKEIYEGDIIKFTNNIDEIYNEEIGVCLFEQDECNFVLQRKIINAENYPVPMTISTIYLISNGTYSKDCKYKIIGNIYENSELLEGEE